MSVAQEIEKIIVETFQPVHWHLINESHLHKGHRGDDGSGESHFQLIIASSAFSGCSRIQRARLVQDALKDLIERKIHALSLKTLTPDEYDNQ